MKERLQLLSELFFTFRGRLNRKRFWMRMLVLYFFMEGRRIVFTNGFQKKTQKTPRKEIETAIRYRADYLKRRKLDEGI